MDPTTIMMMMGAAKSAIGGIQSIAGAIAGKKAMKERKPFETPEEVYENVALSQNLAQGGFDAKTLKYLNQNIDRNTSASLETATRLGGSPNSTNNILDTSIQSILGLGSENAERQFRNFDRFIGEKKALAQSLAAEWQSKDNMLKDKLQAAGQNVQNGVQNFMGGINTMGSASAMDEQAKLYKEQLDAIMSFFPSARTPGSSGSSGGEDWYW